MGKQSAKPLDIADALQIVIDLARQNALDARRCDPELRDEAQRQQEAIDMVEDLAVNKSATTKLPYITNVCPEPSRRLSLNAMPLVRV